MDNRVTTLDLPAIDEVLGMTGGYVLDFSNRTFAMFFADLGIDIDKDFPDGSKGTRLRAFLRAADPHVAARVLEGLLTHRGSREGDDDNRQLMRYRGVIARLGGAKVVGIPSVEIDVLTLSYVRELEAKAELRLMSEDLDGAITVGRTMLEAVLVELERRLVGSPGDHKGDLQRQFKAVAKQLRIDEERPDIDDNFKQVVRGLVQVVNGLAPIRNRMGDSHARERKPALHHARVIVNAAKTVAAFLVESYLFQVEKGLLPNGDTPSPQVWRVSGP